MEFYKVLKRNLLTSGSEHTFASLNELSTQFIKTLGIKFLCKPNEKPFQLVRVVFWFVVQTGLVVFGINVLFTDANVVLMCSAIYSVIVSIFLV